MQRKVTLAVVIMGFSGFIAEIVLLRELLVAFHGNELSIGVILANCLLLESAGAHFVGRRISRPNPDLVFVEEFVHFPMLCHPDPKNVAVLSGGAGGVIHEILKHNV